MALMTTTMAISDCDYFPVNTQSITFKTFFLLKQLTRNNISILTNMREKSKLKIILNKIYSFYM